MVDSIFSHPCAVSCATWMMTSGCRSLYCVWQLLCGLWIVKGLILRCLHTSAIRYCPSSRGDLCENTSSQKLPVAFTSFSNLMYKIADYRQITGMNSSILPCNLYYQSTLLIGTATSNKSFSSVFEVKLL